MAPFAISSLIKLLLLSQLTTLAYASCNISPRSTESDVCAAGCAIAAQCVDQCETVGCLCQLDCLCWASVCQNCCTISKNDAYCHAEAADSLALCSDQRSLMPVNYCNVFANVSTFDPSATFPPAQITSLIQFADVPYSVDLPSASNCAAYLTSFGTPTYQFTYTGATYTASVASFTSYRLSSAAASTTRGSMPTGGLLTSLSLSGDAGASATISSSARIRTGTGFASTSTSSTTTASTTRPSGAASSAPGAAPIGFQVEMMTLGLLLIGTLLVVLA